jgi:hypothetical protein
LAQAPAGLTEPTFHSTPLLLAALRSLLMCLLCLAGLLAWAAAHPFQ